MHMFCMLHPTTLVSAQVLYSNLLLSKHLLVVARRSWVVCVVVGCCALNTVCLISCLILIATEHLPSRLSLHVAWLGACLLGACLRGKIDINPLVMVVYAIYLTTMKNRQPSRLRKEISIHVLNASSFRNFPRASEPVLLEDIFSAVRSVERKLGRNIEPKESKRQLSLTSLRPASPSHARLHSQRGTTTKQPTFNIH
jgi:hypothetical protein